MYKKKRGFTLVETSIYLSILAVVLTIFLQSFNFLKAIKDNYRKRYKQDTFIFDAWQIYIKRKRGGR